MSLTFEARLESDFRSASIPGKAQLTFSRMNGDPSFMLRFPVAQASTLELDKVYTFTLEETPPDNTDPV